MANGNNADIGFEKQIWNAACVLRGNMDASEYKNVVLGLIFLKYISDRFEEKHRELVAEGDGFEEDIDEYTSEGLFKVTSSNYDKWFYYSWTKHHLDRFVAVAADKATTMGHIKRDELAKAEVLIPNEADYKRIRTLLQPIYDLIITNRIENKRLAKIRDILLPKLMSGELDVSAIQL